MQGCVVDRGKSTSNNNPLRKSVRKIGDRIRSEENPRLNLGGAEHFRCCGRCGWFVFTRHRSNDRFFWSDYRPASHPNHALIWHHKNRKTEKIPIPLLDGDGTALFPEMTARL